MLTEAVPSTPTPEVKVNTNQKELYTPPEIVSLGSALELTEGGDGVFSDVGQAPGFKG